MMDGKRGMKGFSVCYDRFCIGRFSLCFDETGELVADACRVLLRCICWVCGMTGWL